MSTGKKGKNNKDIQENNRSVVLQILTQQEICTRVQIAEKTGLQQASITKIIAEFIEAGLVEEIGLVEGKKGRRSIGLRLKAEQVKVAAVKISRDMFQTGLFDIKGKLYEKYSEKTNIADGVPYIVERIKQCIDDMRRQHPEILAIGIAVPGPYDRRTGKIVLMADRIGWETVDFTEEFVNAYDIPVVIDHDADAGALAEWKYGTYHNEKGTLVHLLASEGIGAGIVSNGEILLNRSRISSEIGHMSIDLNGERCSCGNAGCLRLYCSSLALVKRAEREVGEYPESILAGKGKITAEDIFSGMEKGDPFCIRLIRDTGYYMGCGLANIINIFSADAIRISDLMVQGGDILMEAIRSTVKERVLPAYQKSLSIEYSKLKKETVLYGAAALACDMLLNHFRLVSGRLVRINEENGGGESA